MLENSRNSEELNFCFNQLKKIIKKREEAIKSFNEKFKIFFKEKELILKENELIDEDLKSFTPINF